VTDPQQSAVAGAKITAINLATNVQQTAASSSVGLYSLPALEPGTYRLTLSTVSERNEVDAAFSRAAVERV
jgi:hypothetical protein